MPDLACLILGWATRYEGSSWAHGYTEDMRQDRPLDGYPTGNRQSETKFW
jgi:hypothetical protein